MAALVEAHPELADPDNAYVLLQNAAYAAEHLGRPDLANDPKFWAVVHASTPGLVGEQSYDAESALDEVFQGSRSPLPFGPIGSSGKGAIG